MTDRTEPVRVYAVAQLIPAALRDDLAALRAEVDRLEWRLARALENDGMTALAPPTFHAEVERAGWWTWEDPRGRLERLRDWLLRRPAPTPPPPPVLLRLEVRAVQVPPAW